MFRRLKELFFKPFLGRKPWEINGKENFGKEKMIWFKKKDPICGMKEEKGKGIEKDGNWFCSNSCQDEYEKGIKKMNKKHGCCH